MRLTLCEIFHYNMETNNYEVNMISSYEQQKSYLKECGAFMNFLKQFAWSLPTLLIAASAVRASEADLAIPDLHEGTFDKLGGISAWNLLFYGSFVIIGTLGISLYQLFQIHKQPAHKSMLAVSAIIFQTCKTYLIQQGKFLLMLFAIIAMD